MMLKMIFFSILCLLPVLYATGNELRKSILPSHGNPSAYALDRFSSIHNLNVKDRKNGIPHIKETQYGQMIFKGEYKNGQPFKGKLSTAEGKEIFDGEIKDGEFWNGFKTIYIGDIFARIEVKEGKSIAKDHEDKRIEK